MYVSPTHLYHYQARQWELIEREKIMKQLGWKRSETFPNWDGNNNWKPLNLKRKSTMRIA
jgi:hypothetical protein